MKENLWAPWRLDFILGPREKGCIFCKMPRQRNDEKNFILFRGKFNYIILNRYPYNNGHLMVVPFRHTVDLTRLKAKESSEMMLLTGVSIRALERTMFPQGQNIGINLGAAGGAGIRDHLHQHVVPRWVGDTNWMPVLAKTKVMIEYLEQTYDRLAPEIRRLMRRKK